MEYISEQELHLVSNSDVLRLKNALLQKVVAGFAALNEDYTGIVQQYGWETGSPSAKISRGEQYLGLPWVVLGYPRIFTRGNMLVIRTLFWWGHSFSIHLIISGGWKKQYFKALVSGIEMGRINNWYVCIHPSEWHHYFESDNYIELTCDSIRAAQDHPFIKIAAKIPVHHWSEAPAFLRQQYLNLVQVLTHQSGETGL